MDEDLEYPDEDLEYPWVNDYWDNVLRWNTPYENRFLKQEAPKGVPCIAWGKCTRDNKCGACGFPSKVV